MSVRAALASGQSANTWGETDDWTCLMVAVLRGYEEVVTELLQQEDCDLGLETSDYGTALHLACWRGRVGIVRQLASHPRQSSLNRKDEKGRTAIMVAVNEDHKEVVTELLQQKECDLSLALHHACKKGRVGMVRQLALHPRQSSLNSKCDHGNTAIMVAVKNDQAECVLALGRVPGVDLDIRDEEGRSLEDLAR